MNKRLSRDLSLIAVIAGALCSVIGGGINVLIVDVQNEIPGIGNLVPLAIIVAGIIAFIVGLVYAVLSVAMPRAGGSYLYISRVLGPFWGFVLAFLSLAGNVVALGVVAFMDTAIASTALYYAGFYSLSTFLSSQIGQIVGSLFIIWLFWIVNYFGVKNYGKTVVILAALMIVGGLIVSLIGFMHTHDDYVRIVGPLDKSVPSSRISLMDFVYAVAFLFWAYVGFESIGQSGDEIENPTKNLPLAFIATTILVTLYYFVYSSAFYHAVPWQYVYGVNAASVPRFMGVFIPSSVAFMLTFFVFIALANDIPPMLYTKSRLVYSWARDGFIPKYFMELNKYSVPSHALTVVALFASLVSIASALGGFLTEVDVVVVSRFILYIFVSLSLILLPTKKKLYKRVKFMRNRVAQLFAALFSIAASIVLLYVIFEMEVSSGKPIWMLSTFQTAVLALIGVLLYVLFLIKHKDNGWRRAFEDLPG